MNLNKGLDDTKNFQKYIKSSKNLKITNQINKLSDRSIYSYCTNSDL